MRQNLSVKIEEDGQRVKRRRMPRKRRLDDESVLRDWARHDLTIFDDITGTVWRS